MSDRDARIAPIRRAPMWLRCCRAPRYAVRQYRFFRDRFNMGRGNALRFTAIFTWMLVRGK